VLDAGVAVVLVGVPVLVLLPPGFTVEPGVVPEAANATAGATVRITGAVQPALSSVRREITDQWSELSEVSCRSSSSALTWVFLP
jgi:hypothetical protein